MSFASPLSEQAQAHVVWPFVVSTLVWGSTWFVIGSQLHYAPAAWSITWRFAIASIAMFAVARRMRASLALGRHGHALAAVIGFTQFALNYLLVYAAEAHIASGLVALVSALMIVPNALLGRLFLKQSVSRRFLAGSVIAICGVSLLSAGELAHTAQPPSHVLAGVGLAIAGLLAASSANVLQGTRLAARLAAPSLLAWAMAYGSALDAGYALATVGRPRFSLQPVYLVGLLYLAIAGSAVAFSCYLNVIRAIGPARAGYVGVLIPVIAMALSTIFEGYRWSGAGGVGAALTVAGLLVAIRARSPSR